MKQPHNETFKAPFPIRNHLALFHTFYKRTFRNSSKWNSLLGDLVLVPLAIPFGTLPMDPTEMEDNYINYYKVISTIRLDLTVESSYFFFS